MSLLVVGSIALDSIETPFGAVDDALGGSATYFSCAASFMTTPRLVAVVGEDFPESYRRLLTERQIDTAGLVTQVGGKTFRWKGRYHRDMNTRDTLEVHLNVLGSFDPVLPERFRDSTYVFLANSSPALHAKVLNQVRHPKVVFADTMDLWIDTQREELVSLLPRLDGLMVNDSEARQLTRETNLVRAGEAIRRMGPRFVIIKKGEHGAMLFGDDGIFIVPAFPSSDVIDPTGAGDSFAGGILGYLAAQDVSGEGEVAVPGSRDTEGDVPVPPGSRHLPEGAKHLSTGVLRRAMAHGTVVASLTVEGFSLDRLQRTNRDEIADRLEKYRKMLAF